MSLSQEDFFPIRQREAHRVSSLRRGLGIVGLVMVFAVIIGFAGGRIRAFVVNSESMLPTVRPHDHILVLAGSRPAPKRGEIVAVRNPRDWSDALCKRVVAVPGDEVAVRHGLLVINGVAQDDERYVGSWKIRARDFDLMLSDDEYFVLGDNRSISLDSAIFGPVHRANFIGIARWIYWPPARMQALRPRLGVKAQVAEFRHGKEKSEP